MLDLSRSAITVALGIWEVDPTETFEAGAAVGLSSAGLVGVAADGDAFFGVAKWNKTTALTGVVVAEEVTLTAFALSNLKHADLVADSWLVTDAAGTPWTNATDYVVVKANGTINRTSPGSTIPDGATVYVTYRYNYTVTDLVYAGKNYMNLLDDTIGSGKITVIQDYAVLYTDQYDTAVAYSTAGATSLLTVDTGLFTVAGVGTVVAKVISVPTTSDQLLGIMLIG